MKSQAENVYTTANKILYIAPVLLWGEKDACRRGQKGWGREEGGEGIINYNNKSEIQSVLFNKHFVISHSK